MERKIPGKSIQKIEMNRFSPQPSFKAQAALFVRQTSIYDTIRHDPLYHYFASSTLILSSVSLEAAYDHLV